MANKRGFSHNPPGIIIYDDVDVLTRSPEPNTAHASLPANVLDKSGDGRFTSSLVVGGSGAGTIAFRAGLNAVPQTWTITKDVTANEWSVVGSIAGDIGTATTGVLFTNAPNDIHFTITETVAFDPADAFTVVVEFGGANLSANDDWFEVNLPDSHDVLFSSVADSAITA